MGHRVRLGKIGHPQEALAAHLDRVQQHRVEAEEDRDLSEHRQAAAHRVDAVLAIERHRLHLHLLRVVRILLPQLVHLGLELGHPLHRAVRAVVERPDRDAEQDGQHHHRDTPGPLVRDLGDALVNPVQRPVHEAAEGAEETVVHQGAPLGSPFALHLAEDPVLLRAGENLVLDGSLLLRRKGGFRQAQARADRLHGVSVRHQGGLRIGAPDERFGRLHRLEDAGEELVRYPGEKGLLDRLGDLRARLSQTEPGLPELRVRVVSEAPAVVDHEARLIGPLDIVQGGRGAEENAEVVEVDGGLPRVLELELVVEHEGVSFVAGFAQAPCLLGPQAGRKLAAEDHRFAGHGKFRNDGVAAGFKPVHAIGDRPDRVGTVAVDSYGAVDPGGLVLQFRVFEPATHIGEDEDRLRGFQWGFHLDHLGRGLGLDQVALRLGCGGLGRFHGILRRQLRRFTLLLLVVANPGVLLLIEEVYCEQEAADGDDDPSFAVVHWE